ncbi:MAG TPA: ABC transporter ATP-binding protein [Chthoniobacterales bacterium]|nr:ABC transporter ATP-binding protein [Chthoniobacterales bacterium]
MYFELKNINIHYDKVQALENVSIYLEKGEIVALIGANGAGKTSTLRAITALVKPSAGEIWFDGKRIDGLEAAAVVALGISMVPEGRHVYPYMSVKDNLLMGAYLRKDKSAIKQDLEGIYARFPRVKERLRQQAGSLSGGEQQMVVISRALMARPKLLLLDEPSLGLAPKIVRDIARAIVEINRDEGISVVLVEQNSRMALKISNRAYALETGRVALAGNSSDLLNDDHIRKLYLGG